jgi:sporulation protein YlmC with PRC-barrel domain
MTKKLSDLFGLDIYTIEGEKKGKVFDLVINLEKGRIETITTEPLRAKSKQEAKKIINEKSIPYRRVVSAKDILVVSTTDLRQYEDEIEPLPQTTKMPRYRPSIKPSYVRSTR